MVIYLPDGTEAGSGGGGGFANPATEDLDMNLYKVYLYKGATDAESCYLEWDSTNTQLIIHIPTTNAGVVWTVG